MNSNRERRLEVRRKIYNALNLIAGNWRRSDDWIERSIPLWESTFGSVPAEYLNRAVRQHINTGSKAPTVVDIHGALELVGWKGGDRAGCDACTETGWREVAWHRTENNRAVVETYSCACDCPLGSKMLSSSRLWSESVADWLGRANTTAVYHGTNDRPHLSAFERRGDCWSSRQARTRAQNEQGPSESPEPCDDLPF
jgi:hypothetical protein